MSDLSETAAGPLVHWVTFGAEPTGVDFTDHRVAHSYVMGLFPAGLDPATAGERSHGRSAADILFRTDVIGATRHVLVQATVPAIALPGGARTVAFTPEKFRVPAGSRVRFRVAVNPVVRNGRSKTERLLDASEATTHLLDRLTGALDRVEIANHARDVHTQTGPRARPDQMTLDTFDGLATVTDGATLDALRLVGLGRRKAYGAGLLTVQRVG